MFSSFSNYIVSGNDAIILRVFCESCIKSNKLCNIQILAAPVFLETRILGIGTRRQKLKVVEKCKNHNVLNLYEM